jgi:hypothetical protein
VEGRDKIDYLKECVAIQQKWLRAQLCLTCIVIALGVAMIVLANLLSASVIQESNQKLFLTLGGAFISSTATIPLKDVFSRRDKIAALIFLQRQYETLEEEGNAVDAQYVEELDKRFWELIGKTLGG